MSYVLATVAHIPGQTISANPCPTQGLFCPAPDHVRVGGIFGNLHCVLTVVQPIAVAAPSLHGRAAVAAPGIFGGDAFVHVHHHHHAPARGAFPARGQVLAGSARGVNVGGGWQVAPGAARRW